MQKIYKVMKGKSGVTLMELSVVLVIISLLTAGVALGSSLIKSAEMRAVMREFEDIKAGILTFQSTYKFYPGDIPDRTIAEMLNGGAGNGNNEIEHTRQTYGDTGSGSYDVAFGSEGSNAWAHLSTAGMIQGYFHHDNIAVAAFMCRPGVDAPTSKKPGGGYYLDYMSFFGGLPHGNIIGLGREDTLRTSTLYCDGALFSPKEALMLDNKYDDGIPLQGLMYGKDGEIIGDSLLGDCLTAGGEDYVTGASSDAQACTIAVVID